jgi:flagellar biosynthesis/type III secretory pathway chaperone
VIGTGSTPGVAALVDALVQQTELMRALVELLQQDRASIVKHDIEALEESNRRKEEVVLRLHAAERVRQRHSEQVARTLGLADSDVRVSALCARLGPEGQRLHAAAETLRAVVGSLRELVAVSHGFLEQSILGIRGLLGLITSLRSHDDVTYDASGRIAAPAASGGLALRQEA